MTEAERKQALAELQATKEPAMTGITLTYNGEITSWFCGVTASDTTYYYGQLIYLTY